MRRWQERMARVTSPSWGEIPNVAAAGVLFAAAATDSDVFAGRGILVAASMFTAAVAGMTYARWAAWEKSVVVDVVETTVLADSDDAKPPEGP